MAIPYTRPSISQLERDYVAQACEHGWGAKCYAFIDRLEHTIESTLGTPHAHATSSCTGALHLGLAALGIGEGDEVILADTNWIATASPIVHLGAKPVFVDIDPATWCIDPLKAAAAVTPRTKAIIATHLYGNLCDMDSLLDITKQHGLSLIEDAAEALGAVYKGQAAGTLGTFGVFSFHGTKSLTTGEGGAFVTANTDLMARVKMLNNHGRDPQQPRQFWADAVGYKFKLSNIQAALGCAQFERFDELTARKREILEQYRDHLEPLDGVTLNPRQPDCQLGAWMPNAVFDEHLGVTREMLLAAFQAQSIDARVFFWPLSAQPMFESQPGNQHAWDIPARAINLPSFHDMTDEQIIATSDVVRQLVQRKKII